MYSRITASGLEIMRQQRKRNLRQMARGQGCLVRLPGCDGGGETTVLAHYRMAGYSGVGLKPPDEFGAFCCFSCHEAVDGRRAVEGYDWVEIRLAHAEGVMRTQDFVGNGEG